MARPRTIQSAEARVWLGVLLDAAFDPTAKHPLNLARSAEDANQRALANGSLRALRFTARDGQTQLLTLANELVASPEDYTSRQEAEFLLDWCNRWLQPEDWRRLVERVKKRRQRSNLREAALVST